MIKNVIAVNIILNIISNLWWLSIGCFRSGPFQLLFQGTGRLLHEFLVIILLKGGIADTIVALRSGVASFRNCFYG